jgi:hypothetical protein
MLMSELQDRLYMATKSPVEATEPASVHTSLRDEGDLGPVEAGRAGFGGSPLPLRAFGPWLCGSAGPG